MELKEKAITLYQTHSASSIAKELGVSESTIRRWVRGVKKEMVAVTRINIREPL